MSEPTTKAPKPNLSPWFALTLQPGTDRWTKVAAVTGLLHVATDWVDDPLTRVFGACFATFLGLVVLPWYLSLLPTRLPAEVPVPFHGRRTWPLWALGAGGLVAAVAAHGPGPLWGGEPLAWFGVVWLGGMFGGGLLVIILAWMVWRPRRPTGDRALEQLQSALETQGYRPRPHAVDKGGRASITITAAAEQELIWYLPIAPLPLDTVHLLRKHMEHYGFRKGWIIRDAAVNDRLVGYAARFGIDIARPGQFPGDKAPAGAQLEVAG
jgi:hypothetical protein